MIAVSFYLFENSTEPQAHSACRLARKILKKTPKLWWYCTDAQHQDQLNQCLWSFDPQSFISHDINSDVGQVCISAQLPRQGHWIVFNFSKQAIATQDNIEHIIEIIENNENAKIIGRDKFKYYREHNIAPRTFKL